MNIIDFEFKVISSKLIASYNLSYSNLSSYKSICTIITLENGRKIYGEVTPLIGYTDETVQSVKTDLEYFKEEILYKKIDEVKQLLIKKTEVNKVFSLSSILPGLEVYTVIESKDSLSVYKKDLIYALDCVDLSVESLEKSFESILEEGYNTVKIKVGKDIKKELTLIQNLSNINLEDIKIRFDANCGYTYEESCLFLEKCSILLYNNVEYLEQPMCRQCWSEMSLLIDLKYKIPIMIDESIYTIEDIKKSYDIGARFIKIKLCKFGSLFKLKEALEYAKSLGLNVIFGNGVSTDISNFYELNFYLKNKNLIYGASESVGFLKIQKKLKYIIEIK